MEILQVLLKNKDFWDALILFVGAVVAAYAPQIAPQVLQSGLLLLGTMRAVFVVADVRSARAENRRVEALKE